jgi:RsiW-degrading membrane proteinase PrsW (M82 family)
MVLLLAVMLSVAPTALYVGGLYWLDRYEKEPHLLVAAAFIWGSVPAVVVALAAEVFLGLPPDLMGARALVAAPLGLVAAVLQEALKGAAVLFVSIRYRHEFDDPLDGIVYGAVVGFGFAMMRNLIDLVSSCAVYGFAGFGLDPYVEGLLYSLDHGLYTATFGAALGAARLSRVRWRRRVAPAAGFALAVTAHALRNLSTWNVLGVDPVRVLTTCSGVGLLGVVACWSLRRQREALRLELKGELPGALYHALLTPGGRTRAQWQALRAGGLIGLRRTRRLHQRCTELALRKMERSLGSTESELNDEIEQLSKEIHGLKPN